MDGDEHRLPAAPAEAPSVELHYPYSQGTRVTKKAEQAAGGQDHTEYWIPAERLDEFNAHIVGAIEVIAEFHKEPTPD